MEVVWRGEVEGMKKAKAWKWTLVARSESLLNAL